MPSIQNLCKTHLKSVRPIRFVRVYVDVELPPDINKMQPDKMAAMRKDLLNLDEIIANVASSLGYSNVKEEQFKVIKSFIQKNDVLAVLPTGFGKTLCFACIPGVMDVLLPTISGSIIVVISPLTALMENQVINIL